MPLQGKDIIRAIDELEGTATMTEIVTLIAISQQNPPTNLPDQVSKALDVGVAYGYVDTAGDYYHNGIYDNPHLDFSQKEYKFFKKGDIKPKHKEHKEHKESSDNENDSKYKPVFKYSNDSLSNQREQRKRKCEAPEEDAGERGPKAHKFCDDEDEYSFCSFLSDTEYMYSQRPTISGMNCMHCSSVNSILCPGYNVAARYGRPMNQVYSHHGKHVLRPQCMAYSWNFGPEEYLCHISEDGSNCMPKRSRIFNSLDEAHEGLEQRESRSESPDKDTTSECEYTKERSANAIPQRSTSFANLNLGIKMDADEHEAQMKLNNRKDLSESENDSKCKPIAKSAKDIPRNRVCAQRKRKSGAPLEDAGVRGPKVCKSSSGVFEDEQNPSSRLSSEYSGIDCMHASSSNSNLFAKFNASNDSGKAKKMLPPFANECKYEPISKCTKDPPRKPSKKVVSQVHKKRNRKSAAPQKKARKAKPGPKPKKPSMHEAKLCSGLSGGTGNGKRHGNRDKKDSHSRRRRP